MMSPPRLSPLLLVVALVLGGTSQRTAHALVIDDFATGETMLVGPEVVVQSGLDPSHTAGGKRKIDAVFSGDSVVVQPTGGLKYQSNSGYGVVLDYGSEAPLGINAAGAGVDRIVMRFSGSATPSVRLGTLYINGEGLSFGATLAQLGEQGMMELLLADFATDTSVVNTISIDFARAQETGGFVLDEVFLAPTPQPGDYNRDGQVNIVDYSVWRQGYGAFTFQAGLTADGNGDGNIDAADYTIWRDNFGPPLALSAAIAIPEPATMPALLAALASVGGWRRRRAALPG